MGYGHYNCGFSNSEHEWLFYPTRVRPCRRGLFKGPNGVFRNTILGVTFYASPRNHFWQDPWLPDWYRIAVNNVNEMLDVDFTCTRNVGYLCSAFHRARVIYVWFYLGVLGVFSWNMIPDNGKSGWWATRILFAGVPLARACLLSIWLSSQSHKNWLALRFLGLDSWPSSHETHMWQVSGKRVARDTSVRGHDTWIFFKPLDLHFKYRFLVVGREAQGMFR